MNQTLSLTELESFDASAKRHGNERRFLCPICGSSKPRDDEHRSLALNTSTGAYICHRCKEKGLIKENWTKPAFTPRKARAAAALARVFSVEPIPTQNSKNKNASETDESKAQAKLERLKGKMKVWQAAFADSPAQAYLEKRGITPATAKAFGCGYAAAWEHWAKDDEARFFIEHTDERVVFPITERDGNLIAYHGRAITDVFYRSPKISTGDKSLGLSQLPNTLESDVTAIVEGPVDAMALYQCGLTAAALVGTSAGDWLTSALAFRKVFVGMDADESGDQGSDTLIGVLRSRGARAVRLRPTDCDDWAEFLEKFGADALRTFIEHRIAEAFPDFEYESAAKPAAEDFVIEDVFDAKNESGQRVIDYLFAAAAKYGDDFLLTTPTIYAHETERALADGVSKHSKGKLTDAALKTLTTQFVDAHLHVNSVSLAWTGDDVPLFHLTVKSNGERLENVTCNKIQSWILREFWLRQTSEAEISVMNL
jgi:hypothetical protein